MPAHRTLIVRTHTNTELSLRAIENTNTSYHSVVLQSSQCAAAKIGATVRAMQRNILT